jgi:hypothetical protein
MAFLHLSAITRAQAQLALAFLFQQPKRRWSSNSSEGSPRRKSPNNVPVALFKLAKNASRLPGIFHLYPAPYGIVSGTVHYQLFKYCAHMLNMCDILILRTYRYEYVCTLTHGRRLEPVNLSHFFVIFSIASPFCWMYLPSAHTTAQMASSLPVCIYTYINEGEFKAVQQIHAASSYTQLATCPIACD